jgi:ubiquinone/menaquinone biosynthesis C-methylase UbiE
MTSTANIWDESQPGVMRVFQTRDGTRKFYNKISKVYDLLANRSEEPLRQAGLEKLNAGLGEKVLEIGFGTGHCLTALARAVGPTGKVYGIDLSDGMLGLARENLRQEGLVDRADLTLGDAVKLPYQSCLLDGIFISFTLELFDTPEIPRVLAECRRVLRPGGRIVVGGMSKEGGEHAIQHVFEWTHQHLPNFLDCRPIFVRRALEAAGFRIDSVEQRTMWVPVEIVLASNPF